MIVLKEEKQESFLITNLVFQCEHKEINRTLLIKAKENTGLLNMPIIDDMRKI